MVHKDKVMEGVFQFVEREWMPKAENDKDRAAFRTIQAGWKCRSAFACKGNC